MNDSLRESASRVCIQTLCSAATATSTQNPWSSLEGGRDPPRIPMVTSAHAQVRTRELLGSCCLVVDWPTDRHLNCLQNSVPIAQRRARRRR